MSDEEPSQHVATSIELPHLPPPLHATATPVLAVLVGLYGLTLLAIWGSMYFGGDRWWPATVMLFAPRWIYGIPLPLLAIWAAARSPRLLWPLAALAVVELVPIMGFELHWSQPARGPSALRIISFNVEGLALDPERLMEFINQVQPDLVALQEFPHPNDARAKSIVWPPDWQVVHYDEYLLASRLKIVEWKRFQRPGAGNTAGVAYTLERNGETFRFINQHLTSPRKGLEAVLDRRSIRHPPRSGVLADVIRFRSTESEATAAWATESSLPVIVAGDFNMPRDSTLFRRDWSGLADAFSHSGSGFGYTKTTIVHGWKYGARIDHILFDPTWQARRCWVGPDLGSDHLPFIAELE